MLSYMECFLLVTTASQSELVSFGEHLQPDSSDGVAKFSTKFSSLFSQKHLWTLGSLIKETLFISECIYPKESRRRKWKSYSWMQNEVFIFFIIWI